MSDERLKRSKPPRQQHADCRAKPQRGKVLDAALGRRAFLVHAPANASTLTPAPKPRKADANAAPLSNTVLADALRAAGLWPVASQPTPKRKLTVNPPERAAIATAAFAEPPSPTPVPAKKSRAKKPRSKAVAVSPPKRKKRARAQPAAPRPSRSIPARSAEEKAEAVAAMRDRLRSFIDGITSASFYDLLSGWQKHVSLVGYIRTTGRNRDRIPLYQELIDTVELEWHRRGGLQRDETDYFDWPTTEVRTGSAGLGQVGWVPEGVLKYLGYTVGKGSPLTPQSRQAILRRVFNMRLPPFERPSYMREWGGPASAARLRKMAESIASFIRLAKAQAQSDKSVSIAEWEADLEMLRLQYYVEKFGFGWPVI